MPDPGLPYLAGFNLSCKPRPAGSGGGYGGGGSNPVGSEVAPHLVEVTLATQPFEAGVPGFVEVSLGWVPFEPPVGLAEIFISVSAMGPTIFDEDQPLGPTDSSQSPGRMRHGKFFQGGKLRKIGKHNRRTSR